MCPASVQALLRSTSTIRVSCCARQTLLQRNIELFDRLVPTEQAGSGFPLKVINIGDEERAVAASAAMLESGYYTSAVFFPIVKRGAAGLRIMLGPIIRTRTFSASQPRCHRR